MAQNRQGLVQRTQITRKPFFVGFNTINQPNPPYSLTNIEVIKRDILNQFATTMGSRVMLPTFGTRIFELLFDPFDDYTKNAIVEDAVRVIKSDPRVDLVEIDVYQADQALNVVMVLLFKPESITNNLFVSFSLTDKESF